MDWLETTTLQPVLQQAGTALDGVQPTNPSSLTLAIVGLGTYLLFGWGRRALTQHTTKRDSLAEQAQRQDRQAA